MQVYYIPLHVDRKDLSGTAPCGFVPNCKPGKDQAGVLSFVLLTNDEFVRVKMPNYVGEREQGGSVRSVERMPELKFGKHRRER